LTSPYSTLILSLGTPVILSLALGKVAIFATGQLLNVVGLRAISVTCVHCKMTLSKECCSPHHLASATETEEPGSSSLLRSSGV
jgi:hypothetical protein